MKSIWQKLTIARITLDQIKSAENKAWVASLSEDAQFTEAFTEKANPRWRHIAKLTDDELADILADSPTSRKGIIAASVLRSRESWRTPARWALIVAGLSFALAVASLLRTF